MRLSPAVVGRTAVVGLAFGLTASVGIQVIGVVRGWRIARAGLEPSRESLKDLGVLAVLQPGIPGERSRLEARPLRAGSSWVR